VKKKPIIIFKKPTDSIRFWFYKLEPKKMNRTEPKPKKTEPNIKNRAKLEKNQVKPGKT